MKGEALKSHVSKNSLFIGQEQKKIAKNSTKSPPPAFSV